MASVFRVAAPIPRNDVELSVPIQVRRCDTIPPAFELVEGIRLRLQGRDLPAGRARHLVGCRRRIEAEVQWRQLAVIVVKNTDWPPFARQNQFGETVTIQITPHSPANQSCLFQEPAVGFVEVEGPIFPPVDVGIGWLRVAPGLYAAPYKQVQVSVAVDVR